MRRHPTHSAIGLSRGWALLLLACLALIVGGCATRAEVEEIVLKSNYELALAEAGPAVDTLQANPDSRKAEKTASLARLEAFVEQNKDNPVTLNALRLRRALLHLNNRSFALARAAFKDIQPAQLHSDRDRALYNVHEHLLWWYEAAPIDKSGVFFETHGARAQAAMSALLEESKGLAAASAIRDFLLESRAWIGIKLSFDTLDDAKAQSQIAEAVDPYARVFAPEELRQLAAGTLGSDVQPFDLSTRRILRAQGLLATVAGRLRSNPDRKPRFESSEFQAYFDAARQPKPVGGK